MSNVIDSIIANKPIYPAKKQTGNTTFTFNTEGKVKPMNYKGKLLPSRIFPSPIECAKDFKGDIISIGKAARGVANDHELGRINDLGMKIGSGCLGLYLSIKAASTLPKAMEFIGPLTFYGAMSLWPKLAIQAPIKARTGVDVHQEYLDSQGRKKKLFLDPQYVLTDLYSKDDLEKMGDKLKVSKDIPDRDNYIKQRAQKTALQANTLWMLTAGSASGLISALTCNAIEGPLSTLIEKADVISSQKDIEKLLNNVNPSEEKNIIKIFTDKIDIWRFERYLEKHANEKVTDKLINDLLREMRVSSESSKRSQELRNAVSKQLEKRKGEKLGSISDTVKSLKTASSVFGKEQKKLDKYISARIGQKQSSHIANQWDSVCNSLLKSLNLSSKELKTLADGEDLDFLAKKFKEIASNDAQYDKTITELMKFIGDYNAKTSVDVFTGQNGVIKQASKKINDNTREALTTVFGKQVTKEIQEKTANTVIKQAEENASGARNSFYRFVNSLEVFKKVATKADGFESKLHKEITNSVNKYMPGLTKEEVTTEVKELVEICKKIVLDASSTDYIEKLTTQGYELTPGEYRTVIETIFGGDSKTALVETLEKTMKNKEKTTLTKALEKAIKGTEETDVTKLAEGYQKYKEEFVKTIANWKNDMTQPLASRVLDNGNTHTSIDSIKRSNTVASEITKAIKDTAAKKYNTNKWLKIFATSFAALTAITLVAGLYFGRKGDVEKQVEKESKVNG